MPWTPFGVGYQLPHSQEEIGIYCSVFCDWRGRLRNGNHSVSPSPISDVPVQWITGRLYMPIRAPTKVLARACATALVFVHWNPALHSPESLDKSNAWWGRVVEWAISCEQDVLRTSGRIEYDYLAEKGLDVMFLICIIYYALKYYGLRQYDT